MLPFWPKPPTPKPPPREPDWIDDLVDWQIANRPNDVHACRTCQTIWTTTIRKCPKCGEKP
jgi:hypothetical protein